MSDIVIKGEEWKLFQDFDPLVRTEDCFDKLFIPQDVIYIDETTLDSLQIFSALYKNSGSRSGKFLFNP